MKSVRGRRTPTPSASPTARLQTGGGRSKRSVRAHGGVGVGVATLALAATLTFSFSARAQSTADDGRARFAQGVALIQQGRWVDAIAELEAARAVRATPPVLYNLGLAYRAVGRVRDATAAFQELTRTAGATLTADRRSEIDGYLRELATAAGRIEVAATPADATVRIDDATLSGGSHSTDVDPGRHTVTVSANGFATSQRSVEVRRGGTVMLEVRLEREQRSGRLLVESNVADAVIRIDGRDVGNERADETVAAGAHVVEVRASGRVTFRRELTVEAGGFTRIRATLAATRGGATGGGGVLASPVFWAVIGTAAAGALAAGLIVGLSGPEAPYRGSWDQVGMAIYGDMR